jgi:lipopolysaccharide/colanic/teichoic acid biosynthesis glycosyltransferase
LKRSFDVLAGLCGLLMLLPFLVLIAALVFLGDGNTPWFRGVRVGLGGRRFRMVKFRTMIPNAWKSGVSSTGAADRRITRVGKLLRRAKLDELPQLWNVLIGDMSLVGPRPQVEADAALYSGEEQRLFEARPGITDLASIVFADEGQILAGASDPDLTYNQIIRPWKSRLALVYLERRSFTVDIQILWLTLLGAVSREKALRGVGRMLVAWGGDPLLCRMAARSEPLLAWPPPGTARIVVEYRPRLDQKAAQA